MPYFACFKFHIAGTVMFSAVMCSVSLELLLRRRVYKSAFFNVRAALVVNEKVITVAPQSKVSEIVSTTAHTLTVFGFGSFKHITP